MFKYFVSYTYFEAGGFSFGDGIFELNRALSSKLDYIKLKDKIEKDARLSSSPTLLWFTMVDIPTLAEMEGLIPPISSQEDL